MKVLGYKNIVDKGCDIDMTSGIYLICDMYISLCCSKRFVNVLVLFFFLYPEFLLVCCCLLKRPQFCYYLAPFHPLLEASVVSFHVISAVKRSRTRNNQSIHCILDFSAEENAGRRLRRKDHFTPFSLSELF